MERHQSSIRIRNALEPKFYEKSRRFCLYPTTEDKYYTLAELKEALKTTKPTKRKISSFYASNKDAQYITLISQKKKGYQVLLLDSPIVSHLIQKLEADNENLTFAR